MLTIELEHELARNWSRNGAKRVRNSRTHIVYRTQYIELAHTCNRIAQLNHPRSGARSPLLGWAFALHPFPSRQMASLLTAIFLNYDC
jgi:hypothetical protein